jgi:hypothetical protein
MKKILIVFLLSIALDGCSTLGNKAITEPSNFISIKAAETDKPAIFAKFGQPNDVYDQGTKKAWRYLQTKTSPEPATFILGVLIWPLLVFVQTENDISQTDFFFDDKNKLIDVISRKGERRMGMIGMLETLSKENKAADELSVARIKSEMEEQKLPFNDKAAKQSLRYLAL